MNARDESVSVVAARREQYSRFVRQAVPRLRIALAAAVGLKDLARQLQRAKQPGVGERITMATLVRVAVSDLLRNKTPLDGTTEAELLDSLHKP